MLSYIDAHNHILERTPLESLYNTYSFENIKNINNCLNKNKSIGIHPKYINPDLDFNIIEDLLYADDFNIGEIGLDKFAEDIKLQISVVKSFFELSNKYNKSITIHCVKKWGLLCEIIDKNMNRDIPHMFHGFSGSKETLNILLKGNSYFSFSLRELKSDKIFPVIKSIPTGKLLIESDMSNTHYKQIGYSLYFDHIKNTYIQVAELLHIPIDELVPIINDNFKQFI